MREVARYDGFAHSQLGCRLVLTENWLLSLDLHLLFSAKAVLNLWYNPGFAGGFCTPGVSLGINRHFNF